MTTFTTIPNSSLEPGKPIRSIDGLALRDNPIAMFEGDATAPKLQTAAIQDDAVTKDKLQSPTAGTAYLICRIQEAEQGASPPGYLDPGYHRFISAGSHLGVTALVPGIVTCYFEHRIQNAGLASYVRILKNGSQIAEWATTSTSYVARSVNVSIDVGDVIIFQQKNTNSDFGFAFWRALRIYSNNPSMAVA